MNPVPHPTIALLQSSSLTSVVGKEIERQILEGELRPGDRLPAERDLAEKFGTNRNTLREALRTLARKVVKAEQFITHTRPLSQVAEAFEIAASGEALKVMVEPG